MKDRRNLVLVLNTLGWPQGRIAAAMKMDQSRVSRILSSTRGRINQFRDACRDEESKELLDALLK